MAWTWVSSALDYIPVIGSAKNAVEAVGDLIHGDYRAAAEKSLQAAIGIATDVASAGVGGIIEKVAVKSGEEIAEKSVGKFAKGEVVKATKKTFDEMMSETKTPTKLKPRIPRNPSEPEKKRSARGEHVINNDVVKLYMKIVQDFVQNVMHENLNALIASGGLRPDMEVYRAIHNPLSQSTTMAVTTEMVAHIPEDVHYVDANAELYGRGIEILKGNLMVYMQTVYLTITASADSSVIPVIERHTREIVEEFITGEYYVDPFAREFWLNENGPGGRQARKLMYDQAKNEVDQMFRRLKYTGNNDMVIRWIHDLIRATRPAGRYILITE